MGMPTNFDFEARARKMSPNLTLPNGGNDATMQGIVKRGAPAASTGGMMPLTPPPAPSMQAPMPQPMLMPMPAAPLPAPVQPMRSPMAAVSSDRNHSYDAGLGFGSGLAGRGPVPKGRSGYNLDRIAERQWRQNRNPAMLQSQQWYHLQADRMAGGQPGGQPDMMVPMTPMPPPQPTGHFEPGRSTGSQVWVRDAPAGMGGGGDGMMPMDRNQMPQPSDAPMPQTQPQTPQPQQPFGFPFPSLPWSGTGPLPPSTLGGGNGVPPPPPVQRFDVAGPDGQPLAWMGFGPDGKPVPTMHGTYAAPKAAAPNKVPKIYNEGGEETTDPKTGIKSKSATRHYYFAPDPDTGAPVKKYVQDEASGGTGSEGYNPFRKAKQTAAPAAPAAMAQPPAAAAPAPAAPPVTTETGQMPSAAYANDLKPEQQLAAARDHYASTGEDNLLREYFKSNPSQASQLLKQEQDLWQQIGQNSQADSATLDKRTADHRRRDQVLSATTPMLQGAAAQLYDLVHPEQAQSLSSPAPLNTQTNADLMARANELSRQYDAQRASDRLATKEEDFKRGWDLYKRAKNMSMLSDYTKGGKA